jgi:hypothetical protein
MVVMPDGKVGIGTSSPGEKLTVAGVIHSTTGGFRFPDGTIQTTAATGAAGWALTGNAGTNPATNFLGTTDNIALEIRVNNARALRIEPATSVICPGAICPNIIMGFSGNSVGAGVIGATIGGGGRAGNTCGPTGNQPCYNRVTNDFGTVGGGSTNTASNAHATVGGGDGNTASGATATVGGGFHNTAAGDYSFVVGRQAKNSDPNTMASSSSRIPTALISLPRLPISPGALHRRGAVCAGD